MLICLKAEINTNNYTLVILKLKTKKRLSCEQKQKTQFILTSLWEGCEKRHIQVSEKSNSIQRNLHTNLPLKEQVGCYYSFVKWWAKVKVKHLEKETLIQFLRRWWTKPQIKDGWTLDFKVSRKIMGLRKFKSLGNTLTICSHLCA